jgi:toxin-antitoxin system PIN domain toxin
MVTEAGGTRYLLDANILLALTAAGHVHHKRATAWLAGIDRWATTPVTEAALVRLLLNPQVVGRKVARAEALGVLASLRGAPGHEFMPDDSSLSEPMIDLTGLTGHRQVTDLHLVNLAARHGAVLATLDARITATLAGPDARWVCLI